MKTNKAKSVALNVKEKIAKMETESSSHSKGKVEYVDSDNESLELEFDANSDG